MKAIYFTDEEIISGACIIPGDMMFPSDRSVELMAKLLSFGMKTWVVVWLDDTIAFINCSADLKMPPAEFIINEYRKFHNLPPDDEHEGTLQ